MNTYEVPVWFTIQANSNDEAEQKMKKIMADLNKLDQLPDYGVGAASQWWPEKDDQMAMGIVDPMEDDLVYENNILRENLQNVEEYISDLGKLFDIDDTLPTSEIYIRLRSAILDMQESHDGLMALT